MPNYEYVCNQCQKHFEIYQTYQEYGQQKITCPNCESSNVRRIIPAVRIARSEESRIENMVDPAQLGAIDEDPQALGKLMRQMGSELDEDMGPEFDEVVSRLEKGQKPDEIEKEMPNLGQPSDTTSTGKESED